jgi:transposase
MDPPGTPAARFVALDVHKDYVVVAAVDREQRVVLPPRRLSLPELDDWATRSLRPTDAVVLEATTNAWHLHDRLRPLVGSVAAAHPQMVKLITAARVKTAPRDALHLARLLAAGLVPTVWVPPAEVRALRALVAHRRRLVAQRTQVRNRLQSILHEHRIVPPVGKLFAAAQRAWWDGLELGASTALRVRQDLAVLAGLEPLVAAADDEPGRLSTVEPWAARVAYLVQLPGIGLLSAMTLLAGIGDVARFPTAKQLVGYAGLGAQVHDSGQVHRRGGITKQGRRELRATLVEAAWTAVQTHPYWRAAFGRPEQRIGRHKAIVAVARKLLVVAWHVLTGQTADRNADPVRVAFKLRAWAWDVGRGHRRGVSTGASVRRELTRLRLGDGLTTLTQGGRGFRLPPADTPGAPAPVGAPG